MNFKTIEAEKPKKSLIAPVIVGTLSLVALFWIGNHIYGDCLALDDVLHYCQAPDTK